MPGCSSCTQPNPWPRSMPIPSTTGFGLSTLSAEGKPGQLGSWTVSARILLAAMSGRGLAQSQDRAGVASGALDAEDEGVELVCGVLAEADELCVEGSLAQLADPVVGCCRRAMVGVEGEQAAVLVVQPARGVTEDVLTA